MSGCEVDEFDGTEIPFSFDQEVNLLVKMNDNQMGLITKLEEEMKQKDATIESFTRLCDGMKEALKESKDKIDKLSAELVEACRNREATVSYVYCSHCQPPSSTNIRALADALFPKPPPKIKEEEEKKE